MLVLFVGCVLPTPVELNDSRDGVPLRIGGVGPLSRTSLPETAVRDTVVEGV
jgi:hypothetical protein